MDLSDVIDLLRAIADDLEDGDEPRFSLVVEEDDGHLMVGTIEPDDEPATIH